MISIHALLAESDCRKKISENRYKHFYPRSPCGERRNARLGIRQLCAISIHALLAESDTSHFMLNIGTLISIHALLAESDYSGHLQSALGLDFYPRSPCGERPASGSLSDTSDVISIHALLAESDLPHNSRKIVQNDFYPRSPCGERLPEEN